MMTRSKEKFIHDVETAGSRFTSREPFKVQREDKRAFVRLEISAPISLLPLRNGEGELTSEIAEISMCGTILNLSMGGILVDLEGALAEGSVVSMRFVMQGDVTLDNILGLVKRCDVEGENSIAGIEFLTEQRLADLFSTAEVDLLSERFTDFNAGLKSLLGEFIIKETSPDSTERYNAAP